MTKLLFLLGLVLCVALIQAQKQGKRKQPPMPCDVGCADCGVLRLYCKRCQSGYKLRGAFCKLSPTKVNSCKVVPNCLDCPGTIISFLRSCKVCQRGWSLHHGKYQSICVKSCPKGYRTTSKTLGLLCQQIPDKCPRMPGCDKCPTEYLCSKCAGNLILHDGAIVSKCVKTCPLAHKMVIKNGVKVCKLEEGCYDSRCNSCKNGWVRAFYKGQFCHRNTCPNGYYTVWSHFCRKCTQGCKTCDYKSCKVCNKGLSLYRDDHWRFTQCRAKCPFGYISELIKGSYTCRKVSQASPQIHILLPQH